LWSFNNIWFNYDSGCWAPLPPLRDWTLLLASFCSFGKVNCTVFFGSSQIGLLVISPLSILSRMSIRNAEIYPSLVFYLSRSASTFFSKDSDLSTCATLYFSWISANSC
jgi:hypothetical protein